MCTLKKFCHLKFFLKKWWFFQNVNNLLFISATLSNICCKAYEKTYIFFFFFFNILKLSLYFYMFTKLHDHKILLKNAVRFNMWTKSCLFQQLWTIFSTKIMKYHTIFATYFWSLFQFLHCDAVLLWPHFYSKNDSCFNVANKMLFISKGMLFTPFLSCLF